MLCTSFHPEIPNPIPIHAHILASIYVCISDPSTYSRWSDWKCQEVCYNPYKKHLTHEIRERTCTDASPMHSTQNCAIMDHTRDFSNLQCDGRSAVPPCKSYWEEYVWNWNIFYPSHIAFKIIDEWAAKPSDPDHRAKIRFLNARKACPKSYTYKDEI